jgi:hypothetical protein
VLTQKAGKTYVQEAGPKRKYFVEKKLKRLSVPVNCGLRFGKSCQTQNGGG